MYVSNIIYISQNNRTTSHSQFPIITHRIIWFHRDLATDTKFSKSARDSKDDYKLSHKKYQIQHFMNMYSSFLEICIFLNLTGIQRNISEVKAIEITFRMSSECQAIVLITLQCARIKSRQSHDTSLTLTNNMTKLIFCINHLMAPVYEEEDHP